MPLFHGLLKMAHQGTGRYFEKPVTFYEKSFAKALKKCKKWPGTKKSVPLFLQQLPSQKP